MEKEENILGTEKIGKLMIKFAVPSIISLLVNSIYNLVDQIFIGWGVGYLGNGATNIVFPLVMLCLAFSLMMGDGSSAFLSLKLGEKKKEEATKGVVNGILISIIIATVFCIGSISFLPQLLNIFGCTDILRPYALDYGYVIAIGLFFMMTGTVLNSIIRADGSPRFSMITMVSGAILNIILDPIFIFVFGMGVKGAAIATAMSQFLTFILNASYLRKLKTIEVSKKDIKLELSIVRKILTLGISSFITQMSFVFVVSVENNLIKKYGVLSEYGAEIPITVIGIVMKINQILNSMVIGLAVGSQPIIGYNYGAEKYDRVKGTLKRVLIISAIIGTVAFVLFQTIPDKLISIFGTQEGQLYVEFACMTFRIYLSLCIFSGIQIASGIFFQAIGKSSRSAILSLSRQILFLIPAMIILCSKFGVKGILYSGPVADALAFTISAILIIVELKNLGKKEKYESKTLVDDTSTDNKLNNDFVITISREYGSGGRYIGRLVADKLGIKYYDKDFVTELSSKTGLTEEYIESNEQKRALLSSFNNGYYAGLDGADELFVKESELVENLADRGSCVIIGRCADFVLRNKSNVIKVFVYSSMKDKVHRVVKYYGVDKSKAEKEINKQNKLRANHYKHYTDREWTDIENYDIAINSDVLGVEKSANLICELIKEKDLKKR